MRELVQSASQEFRDIAILLLSFIVLASFSTTFISLGHADIAKNIFESFLLLIILILGLPSLVLFFWVISFVSNVCSESTDQ